MPTNVIKQLPSNLVPVSKCKPARLDNAIKAPFCPQWVSVVPGAKAIWKRHAKDMAMRHVWRSHYRDRLGRYCVHSARYQDDPASFTAADLAQILRLEIELELTPASNRKGR